MRQLAPHDRPREKLARLGAGALGDNELLAIVLGQGHGSRTALELANAVLLGAGGLVGLTRTGDDDLRLVAGIGRARASQVLAAIELGRRTLLTRGRERLRFAAPSEVAAYLLPQFGARGVEQAGVVLLDARRGLLKTALLTVGTADASLLHPRDVFREAVVAGAAGVVIFHNHPSGDPTPTAEDRRLTERMAASGHVMGIDLVDHLILADSRYYSFHEAGILTDRR